MDYTWHQMPQQQQMRVDGHEGAGHGGRGSYGGGSRSAGEGRDRQDRAREARERETGSIYGGGGGAEARAQRDQRAARERMTSRRAQLGRMMSAQHRDRRARGVVDPGTGLSAATGLEMAHERETQENIQARREMFSGIIGALMGAAVGVPGIGALAKMGAKRGREDRIGAAMAEYEETGMLTGRPAPVGGGQRGVEGSDPITIAQGKPKAPPVEPEKPEPLDDPYDQFWLDQFGFDPTDPRLRDPSFSPGAPGRPSASASRRRMDLQGPGGNPTLAFMGQVNRDIERSRARRRMAGPM